MITFDQKLVDYLNAWQPNGWPVGNLILCTIALFLCTILIGVIGIEREWRGRSAGLRTHLLVGVGSTIVMIVSIYGFPQIFVEHRDVARLAAQVITGVGFLGAGAIIHRNGIKGLTTAGTIWCSMAIGLACGSFNFILAVSGTGLIFIILTFFRAFERKIGKSNPTIVIVVPGDKPALEKILAISKEYNAHVADISTNLVEESKPRTVEITFQAVFNDTKANVPEYLAKLERETNAISVYLLSH